MATLEAHHPRISVRTRARQPASFLAVILIAAVTLGLAIVIAELGDSTGGGSRSHVATAEPPPAPGGDAGRASTELSPTPSNLPRGYTRRYEGSSLTVVPARPRANARYDGGPEEGTRGPSR
jgi:hypothetical protein